MTLITSDQIRDISVKTVEGFLNNKIPLSEGLAKYASAMELNSDQIQRAIEATNSIAYLKVLSLADDRTVEFPLCKYAEVMTAVTMPIMKTASEKEEKPNIIIPETLYGLDDLCDADKNYYFTKLAGLASIELEALKDREITIVPELIKLANAVKKDIQGLEKLATVASGKTFAMASVLVYGEVQPHEDTGIFKTAELEVAESFIKLFKQAQDLNIQVKEKNAILEKSVMHKQAMLGAIGQAVGHGLGATIAAPVSVAANAAKRTASNVGNSIGDTARSIVGKQPLNRPIKRFGMGAGALAAGGVAADAMMYTPGTDKTTGRSKGVWTTLQREAE